MRFILIGAGDVGTTLAERLVGEQHDVTLIEKDEQSITRIPASLDIEVIHGNGCSPDVLLRAGLRTADYVISVANIDEVNIASCLIAKLIHPGTKRVARIRDIELVHNEISPEHVKEYFDLIINPDQAAADYLLRLFKVAGAKEVIDFCDEKLRVLSLRVSEDSPFVNRKLKELIELRDKLTVLILAIVRNEELLIPRGNDTVLRDDILYCITIPEKTGILFEMAGKTLSAGRSAMIWGGGSLGRSLAHALELQGTKTKVIVSKEESTIDLVDELPHSLILTGDGKDRNLLVEENISEIDAFIAATPDEEDNILSALLARKLGARTSMALVNKASYLPLVHSIGVDVVVSSRMAAAGAIFSHIHSDSFVSEFSLRHHGVSFIEIVITETMPVSGKTLAQAHIPRGILFAAIVHDEQVVIPTGEDILNAGDRVVIFCTDGMQSKLEKLLDMKLEFSL